MTTKRKSPPEDPVKTVRTLIDKIRKELSCTEAEAHFTLRCIASPPTSAYFERKPEELGGPPHASRERALAFTKDLLATLEEYRVKVEAGKFAAFLRALQVCGATGFPLPDWLQERIGKAHADYAGHKAATVAFPFVGLPSNWNTMETPAGFLH